MKVFTDMLDWEDVGVTGDNESIQIIVEQGQMVITNPQYVLSYLGKDMITCLLKQNVDLGLFAKDLVDLLNEQTIEEAV